MSSNRPSNPSNEFTVYDALVEAQSYFKQQAQTFDGYHQGKYWRELVEATERFIAAARPADETKPARLEDHENYCNEHGGHLRDSPSCYLARERERAHK